MLWLMSNCFYFKVQLIQNQKVTSPGLFMAGFLSSWPFQGWPSCGEVSFLRTASNLDLATSRAWAARATKARMAKLSWHGRQPDSALFDVEHWWMTCCLFWGCYAMVAKNEAWNRTSPKSWSIKKPGDHEFYQNGVKGSISAGFFGFPILETHLVRWTFHIQWLFAKWRLSLGQNDLKESPLKTWIRLIRHLETK